MTLSSAVSSFVNSIYELLASFVNAFLAIINGALGVVKGVGKGAGNLLAEAVRMLGGLGGFIAGNFVALSVGGLLVYAYLRYSRGRPAGGSIGDGKKTR